MTVRLRKGVIVGVEASYSATKLHGPTEVWKKWYLARADQVSRDGKITKLSRGLSSFRADDRTHVVLPISDEQLHQNAVELFAANPTREWDALDDMRTAIVLAAHG